MDTFLGSLVQLCCGEGGTLQTNTTGVCREYPPCLGHIGFAPTHDLCAFPVYTAQAPGCSARSCLMWTLGCMHFPGLSAQVQILGYSTMVQTCLGLRFVPFPGLSSSGDQVLGESTLPGVLCLITSMIPATWFPWVRSENAFSGCHVSPLGS